jgi:hypothetical protein
MTFYYLLPITYYLLPIKYYPLSITLQHNRYILQNYYGVQVSLMGLASFHPNKDDYYFAEVPVMDSEIESIITVTQEGKYNRVMSPESMNSDSTPVDMWGPPRPTPVAVRTQGGNSGLPLPSNNRPPPAPAPVPTPAYVPASQRYPNPNSNQNQNQNNPSPNTYQSPRRDGPGQMRPPQTTNMNELPF